MCERMENSKDFGRFCHPNSQNKISKGSCLSKLSMRESIFSDPHHEFDHGRESPSERERQDSSVYNEEYKHVVQSADQSSHEESDADENPNAEGDKQLMDRPKPYHEFLDEFKQQELKAEIEAWTKAEHMRLVTKLREEEAAIDDWEFKQTSKALKEIKKIESKLEKQRAKAVENTWKNMRIAKEEAHKKKIKVRRSTIGKISAVSETYQRATFSTKKLIWHKVAAYCKSMYLKSVRCTALTSEMRRS
ncbi:Remorin family protein [Prunus dulcis]|uniref:Remorin family protein n=1 Tax=Prunus dulcis TaxID=3755 RepID=A0A4Y1QZR7_PRUDU|nr:Remorin family protein [Prunus dulcis]